jgi:hypothetical protein
MANRSSQMNAALVMMTATAVSLGAVAAAILAYNSLLSETGLSLWILSTPAQLARSYRAARCRRRFLLTKIRLAHRRKQEILVSRPEMLQSLVEEIFDKTSKNQQDRTHIRSGGPTDSSPPSAAIVTGTGHLCIDRIEQNQDGEYILWFIRTRSASTGGSAEQDMMIRVPLLPFCRAVADSQQINTFTLCFLHDATGGQDEIIAKLLQVDPSVMSCPGGPSFWLKQWSTDLHLSKVHKDLVLQSLVRVQAALLVPAQTAAATTTAATTAAATTTASSKTLVLVPISTEYVPILLAALHSVFPHDKHIFLYTGCVQAAAAVKQQQQRRRPLVTPLQPLASIHLRKSREFHAALAKLPWSVSASVEAWMAAVDALIIRQDDYWTNGFRPYVCRLDYLLLDAGGNNATERKWAVRSLLQYCGAAANDATADQAVVEAALKTIQALPSVPSSLSLSRRYAQEIDAVVFCHQRILMAHRILPDTVPPVEHWALKEQQQTGGPGGGGCACCIFGMEDAEADEELLQMGNQGISSINTRSSGATNYADGRMGFAFDPARFG